MPRKGAGFNDTHVRCSQCREWLSRDLFTRDASRPSGTIAYCRPCVRARRRARYATDPEFSATERERGRRTYRADPQAWNAKRVEWAKRNPEKRRASEARHRERHTARLREQWALRRALRRASGSLELELVQMLRADPCSYCGGPGGTLDHIAPVSAGGTNDEANLVGACQPCNSRKGSAPLLQALIRMNGVRCG
jgi:5-methylcytosine-specific restriction endonuclease McrA